MTSTYLIIISTGKDLLIAYEQKKEMKDNSIIIVQQLSDFKMYLGSDLRIFKSEITSPKRYERLGEF